jgi:hypothetical protein
MPDNDRAAYAREIMIGLQIPTVALAEMLDIRAARVSDFKSGKKQPAALERKITDAVYHIQKIWDAFGFRVPLHELATAQAKLEFIDRLSNFNGLRDRKIQLQAELERRAVRSAETKGETPSE